MTALIVRDGKFITDVTTGKLVTVEPEDCEARESPLLPLPIMSDYTKITIAEVENNIDNELEIADCACCDSLLQIGIDFVPDSFCGINGTTRYYPGQGFIYESCRDAEIYNLMYASFFWQNGVYENELFLDMCGYYYEEDVICDGGECTAAPNFYSYLDRYSDGGGYEYDYRSLDYEFYLDCVETDPGVYESSITITPTDDNMLTCLTGSMIKSFSSALVAGQIIPINVTYDCDGVYFTIDEIKY